MRQYCFYERTVFFNFFVRTVAVRRHSGEDHGEHQCIRKATALDRLQRTAAALRRCALTNGALGGEVRHTNASCRANKKTGLSRTWIGLPIAVLAKKTFDFFLFFFFSYFIGCWLLAIGYWLLSIVYWLLAIGYWLLAIGYWVLAIGYCLLAIGYWLLAIVYWLARVIKRDKRMWCVLPKHLGAPPSCTS
jgi:hypothetical protein